MTDEITLTFPAERPFRGVAHLVLGGLAVRLDLTFEHLEDLQLALAGLLERQSEEGDVTVSVRVEGDELTTSIGAFEREALEAELDRAGADGVSLRRVLETVADRVEVAQRDGSAYVELTKRVERIAS